MKKAFFLFIITLNFTYSQISTKGKVQSRYDINYTQLKSNIKKQISNQLDKAFIEKYFLIGDSLNFELQLIFDEKGHLKNDQTIVYSNSTLFNNKIVSLFEKYPKLSPEEFPFSNVTYSYSVFNKLEFVVDKYYQLIPILRDEINRKFYININPSEKNINKFIKEMDKDYVWKKNEITVPINFTLNSNYTLSNITIFNDNDAIRNRIWKFISNIKNCFFYIFLEPNKNYSLNFILKAYKNQKSFEKNKVFNFYTGFYSTEYMSSKTFPIFPFCSENNLSNTKGVYFLYSLTEFIKSNINQNEINNMKGKGPFIAITNFKIDANGLIKDIEIKKGNKTVRKELLRTLKKLPRLEPGRSIAENKPIDVFFNFPIFILKN